MPPTEGCWEMNGKPTFTFYRSKVFNKPETQYNDMYGNFSLKQQDEGNDWNRVSYRNHLNQHLAMPT